MLNLQLRLNKAKIMRHLRIDVYDRFTFFLINFLEKKNGISFKLL